MTTAYEAVQREITTRVNELVAKSAGLSEADALSAVFKADPQLYRRYREASEEAPAPAPTRTRSTPALSPVEAEIEARTQTRLAKSAGLSQVEALREVFHEDPDLYQRYRQQAGRQGVTPTPSPEAPLPPWQPPDRDLFRYIPADVQRAVLKAALALEPTNARRGLQRVCERLTGLHDA
jgi:hypothetical protein